MSTKKMPEIVDLQAFLFILFLQCDYLAVKLGDTSPSDLSMVRNIVFSYVLVTDYSTLLAS